MVPQIFKAVCILTIFFCVVPIIGAQQLSPEPQPGIIEGTVIDVTGGVVPGATVMLEGQNKNERETIPMKQTWHGHSAFRIEAGEAKILIDPFLSDNPSRDNGWSGYLTGKNSTQGGDR